MNHSTWNLRSIPTFDEETFGTNTPNSGISISGFQEQSFYTDTIKQKLILYINSCAPIVSSTFERKNAYTKEFVFELTYYTDGHVIFNNLLLEYIKQNDFVIPDKWFKIISDNDFILGTISVDVEKVFDENIDIFNTAEETFEQIPTIAQVIRRDNVI